MNDTMMRPFLRSYTNETREVLGVGFQSAFVYSVLLGYYWPLHIANEAARKSGDIQAVKDTCGDLIQFEIAWCDLMPDDIAAHCINAVDLSIEMVNAARTPLEYDVSFDDDDGVPIRRGEHR